MLKGNNKNEFGDKGYKMKDNYEADKLVVGKFQRISSSYIELGPVVETTTQKYIFELIHDRKKIRYREIFTGFITDNIDEPTNDGFDSKYFDLPYVYQSEKFTEYFPECKGLTLPKLSLIRIQNDINYSKENENENVKTKIKDE